MADSKKDQDERRDDLARRILRTPPQPRKENGKPTGKKGESPAKPAQKGAPKRRIR